MSIYEQLSPATQSLKGGKHLLGFSGGVDSVALFFILLRLNVSFDIAIVHYHVRKQADEEVLYAKELAQKYHKQCFIAHAPHFHSDFEHNARNFRFRFFDDIMATHHYHSLILAHQLNDRFEWFIMQLTQGAGLNTLLGFDNKRTYPIVRPLESIPKNRLYEFCSVQKLKYFEDISNTNTHFKRNYFRHTFCNQMIEHFSGGIAKSMAYLEQDKLALLAQLCPQTLHLESLAQKLSCTDKTTIFAFDNKNEHLLLLACDRVAKYYAYILSSKQREVIKKSHFSCKIHHIIIAKAPHKMFIAFDILSAYNISTHSPMDKAFKALCASLYIPPKLRPLLWSEFCLFAQISDFPQKNTNTDKSTLNKEIHHFCHIFYSKIKDFFSP